MTNSSPSKSRYKVHRVYGADDTTYGRWDVVSLKKEVRARKNLCPWFKSEATKRRKERNAEKQGELNKIEMKRLLEEDDRHSKDDVNVLADAVRDASSLKDVTKLTLASLPLTPSQLLRLTDNFCALRTVLSLPDTPALKDAILGALEKTKINGAVNVLDAIHSLRSTRLPIMDDDDDILGLADDDLAAAAVYEMSLLVNKRRKLLNLPL